MGHRQCIRTYLFTTPDDEIVCQLLLLRLLLLLLFAIMCTDGS
jgi:hypothetical protein